MTAETPNARDVLSLEPHATATQRGRHGDPPITRTLTGTQLKLRELVADLAAAGIKAPNILFGMSVAPHNYSTVCTATVVDGPRVLWSDHDCNAGALMDRLELWCWR